MISYTLTNHKVVLSKQGPLPDHVRHVPHGSADVGGLYQRRRTTRFGSGRTKIFSGARLVSAPQYIFSGHFGQ
mgnify:CR=1 FL=1